MNSCLSCTPDPLPDFAPPGCGWRDLTDHRSIVACVAGACWRRFSPPFLADSAISGAYLTRTDCAGTTVSRAPTFSRQSTQNRTGFHTGGDARLSTNIGDRGVSRRSQQILQRRPQLAKTERIPAGTEPSRLNTLTGEQ